MSDPLTGLHTKQELLAMLEKELARSRANKSSLAFMIADFDNMKQTLDYFGIPVGEDMLLGVANLLSKKKRWADSIGRYYGDEFAVVLPEVTDQEAFAQAEGLRQAVANNRFMFKYDHWPAPEQIPVTISIGLVFISAERVSTISVQEITAAAEQARDEAKRQGRNRTIIVKS